MTLTRTIITAAILLIATGAAAQVTEETQTTSVQSLPVLHQTRFFLAPSFRYTGGETEYVMDIRQYDVELGVLKLKSQLEFPLDGVLAGGNAGFHILRYGRPIWRFELGLWTNVNDPGGIMYDHDWANFYTGVYEKFSYTESDVEMNSLLIDARVARALVSYPAWSLSLFGGYRYQKIEQDVIGFAGWQLVPTDADPTVYERIDFDVDDLLGITYEVTYNLPQAGLLFTRDLDPRFRLSASAAYTLVSVSDRDDHVLRSKLSTADITGHGVLSSASLEYSPLGDKPGAPFFALSGDFDYLSASGSQTQYWYEDEMGLIWNEETNEWEEGVVVPAGTRLENIPHDIHSLQYRIGLSAGLRF